MRSPALPLLLPCPLPPPYSPVGVFSGMVWGEGAHSPGESRYCGPQLCFTRRQGSHSCFLPPCSCSPGTCDLRHSSGLSYCSKPFIIWLQFTFTGFCPSPYLMLCTPASLVALCQSPLVHFSLSLPYAHYQHACCPYSSNFSLSQLMVIFS